MATIVFFFLGGGFSVPLSKRNKERKDRVEIREILDSKEPPPSVENKAESDHFLET